MTDIEQAAADIIDQLRDPLDAESKAIVQRTLVRLHTLTARALIAPASEIEQIKNDAKADFATLASIADASAAQAVQLFQERVVAIVSGILGRAVVIA